MIHTAELFKNLNFLAKSKPNLKKILFISGPDGFESLKKIEVKMYTSFKQPLLNYCSLMVLFHWLHCSKQPLMWYFSIGCTALNSLSYGTFPLAVLLYTLYSLSYGTFPLAALLYTVYSLSYGTFPLAALLYTASHMVLFHWLHCSIQPLIWYWSTGYTALYSLSYGTFPLAALLYTATHMLLFH